ncbi:hypothetical protein GLAREA_00577 [Glarea lozoyensis ATCC 20868]|uniref:Heterokaryon incompatibility domain-containing protein n=1 Tax=Glarea lozoyensis (strain ATCC 20868 / MF5171) TaxID=1116229 RepID=S3CSL1_GLAL2|nr:uncharacterized protein GLAREA_00577 [Glarea lozoyensis ATCC 20868]EPE29417.1 hypothetical protein GLAREA_00577 [Glarea lozoyensis ATCC 20868]
MAPTATEQLLPELETLLVDLYDALDDLENYSHATRLTAGAGTSTAVVFEAELLRDKIEIFLTRTEEHMADRLLTRTWRNFWGKTPVQVKRPGEISEFRAMKMPLTRLVDGMKKISSKYLKGSRPNILRQHSWIFVDELIDPPQLRRNTILTQMKRHLWVSDRHNQEFTRHSPSPPLRIHANVDSEDSELSMDSSSETGSSTTSNSAEETRVLDTSSDEDKHGENRLYMPGVQRKLIDPAWIDIEMLGHWLRTCDSEHGEMCSRPLGVDSSTLARPALLIDVKKKCLTWTESSFRYACLSYVWGGSATLKTVKDNLQCLLELNSLKDRQDEIPRTIRDTIGLVEQLNIQYLWVDALCVVQDDVESKHTQIQAMAGIYANAYLTIVAASGWDADHGLRGIQGVTEPRQVSSFSKGDFQENLQPFDSIWYSRGWTFQELALSPRKLMFQYKVAIWECNKSAWNEASLLANQARHSGSHIAQSRISPWKPMSLTEFPDIALYIRLVSRYVTRKLTYPSDGLHAITGLLSLLSSSFPGRFISGLPEMFFDAALLWQPEEVMQRRRAPSLVESPPSWSWVAWEGKIDNSAWLRHFVHREIHLNFNEDRKQGRDLLRATQVLPLVQWYAGDTLENATRIKTAPCSWEKFDAFPKGMDLPGYLHWKKYFNNNYVYKETKVGNTSTSVGCSTYPLPLSESETEPPISARYLFGHVKRCLLKVGRKLGATDHLLPHYMTVALNNGKGERCGALNLLLSPDDIGGDLAGKTFEMVAISRGELLCPKRLDPEDWEMRSRELLDWGNFREAKSWEHDRLTSYEKARRFTIIEFYYVLWIEWEDGIAYRKGLGRVLKEAWDGEGGDEIDLVLG